MRSPCADHARSMRGPWEPGTGGGRPMRPEDGLPRYPAKNRFFFFNRFCKKQVLKKRLWSKIAKIQRKITLHCAKSQAFSTYESLAPLPGKPGGTHGIPGMGPMGSHGGGMGSLWVGLSNPWALVARALGNPLGPWGPWALGYPWVHGPWGPWGP